MLDLDMSKLALIFLTFQERVVKELTKRIRGQLQVLKLVENWTLKELRNGRMTEGSKCYVHVREFVEVGNGFLFANLWENLNKLGNVCILVMLQFWAFVV